MTTEITAGASHVGPESGLGELATQIEDVATRVATRAARDGVVPAQARKLEQALTESGGLAELVTAEAHYTSVSGYARRQQLRLSRATGSVANGDRLPERVELDAGVTQHVLAVALIRHKGGAPTWALYLIIPESTGPKPLVLKLATRRERGQLELRPCPEIYTPNRVSPATGQFERQDRLAGLSLPDDFFGIALAAMRAAGFPLEPSRPLLATQPRAARFGGG